MSNNPFGRVPDYQVELLEAFREHPYREVDGFRYVSVGEGVPVVLLPGGFMAADMWFYVAQHLTGAHVMIPDSHVIQGVYDLRSVGEHLAAMLEEEGIASASFVGASAGGGVVQYLLSYEQELVDRAVLSHTTVLDPIRIASMEQTLRGTRFLPTFLLRKLLMKNTSKDYPESDWREFTRAFVTEAARRSTKDAFQGWMQGSIDLLEEYEFTAWNGPTLLVSSEDDDTSRPALEELKERYPQAEVHVFEDGGHHTLFLRPEAYTEVLQAFLVDR